MTHNWEVIGHKSSDNHWCTTAPNLLNGIITEVTGIPRDVLFGFEGRRRVISKDTKMAWAANRRTTKVEDVAYCLMGIFGVHMVMIYGEGERNARKRLEQEITNKEREEALDSDIPIYHQSTPQIDGSYNDHSMGDWHLKASGEQSKDNITHFADLGSKFCGVCGNLMISQISTACVHSFCESCMLARNEDQLRLLYEPGDSEATAESDVAVQNFGRSLPCPVCGIQTWLGYDVLPERRLQAEFPTKYTGRALEITKELGDCELLTILIGNWHELVDPNAHRWTFFVTPSRTDIVDLVHIELHDTFEANRENLFRRPPYTIHGQGWGYFTIQVSMVLRSGYAWVCKQAEAGPHGAPNTRLRLEWTLDFDSQGGRGSKGRCSVKSKRARGR